MGYNVACIIVTYNRKTLLRQCLDAVAIQSYRPFAVYVVDNASTDDTMLFVKEWGYYNINKNGIEYKYILNEKNEGGAGGFYLGLKTAFESGEYDAFWLMDDDGVPTSDCLERLMRRLDKYDYLSPIVVDKDDDKNTSFMGVTVAELLKRGVDGIIENECNPFNGVLFSHRLVETVGFPKKEMFIWGDEINYNIRVRQAGFMSAMVTDAIFRHPINRQQCDTYFGNRTCVIAESNLKLFCMLRNMIYNYRISEPFFVALRLTLKQMLIYNVYYLVRKRNLQKTALINKAIAKGFAKNFGCLDKYKV